MKSQTPKQAEIFVAMKYAVDKLRVRVETLTLREHEGDEIVAYKVIDRDDGECMFSGVEYRSRVADVTTRQLQLLCIGSGFDGAEPVDPGDPS